MITKTKQKLLHKSINRSMLRTFGCCRTYRQEVRLRLCSPHEATSVVAKTANGLSRALGNQKGQATLEYVLVGIVILAVILGMAALQRRLSDGLFIEHAKNSLSHTIGPNTGGVIGDVLLY